MPGHELHAELRALKRFKRRLVTAANRQLWRDAVQRRATRISALVRRLVSLTTREGAVRLRATDGWVVVVADEQGVRCDVFRLVTRNGARTLDQIEEAIPLHVLAPDLVKMDQLEQLGSSGAVVLVPPKAA